MKWYKPVQGETRVVRRFLLFPLELIRRYENRPASNETRWLEWANILQAYGTYGWVDNEWVDDKIASS